MADRCLCTLEAAGREDWQRAVDRSYNYHYAISLSLSRSLPLSIHIYIYIYTYTHSYNRVITSITSIIAITVCASINCFHNPDRAAVAAMLQERVGGDGESEVELICKCTII